MTDAAGSAVPGTVPGGPADSVSMSDPWIRRWAAWALERFPPGRAAAVLLIFVPVVVYGRWLVAPAGVTPALGWLDVAGFLAFLGLLYTMRVIDEHKDYDEDCVNYPERVLQRGLVTKAQLRATLLVAIPLQIGVSLAYDHGIGAVTAAWAVTFAWLLLLWRELFVGQWLRRHFMVYALTHVPMFPLMTFWVTTMGARRGVGGADVVILLAMTFCVGFAGEMARKMRAPERELEHYVTYTKVLGTRRACAVASALLVAGTILAVVLLARTGGADYVTIPLAAATGLYGVVTAAVFARKPTPKAEKLMFNGIGSAMVTFYVLLFTAVVTGAGLAWT